MTEILRIFRTLSGIVVVRSLPEAAQFRDNGQPEGIFGDSRVIAIPMSNSTMTTDTTRASLLLRMRDPDDGRAWREFDRRYGELIVRYCRARGLQLMDAEDVRQLVLLSLSRSMPRFEYQPDLGRFRDYLRRTVRNAIIRYANRHTSPEVGLEPVTLESVAPIGADEMDAEWERQWTRLHCREALRTLRTESNAEHVDVFERLLAGDSIQDAAAAFGITPEAVRKIKQRAKERLQALILRQLREEDGHD